MGDSQIDRMIRNIHRCDVTGLYNSPTPTNPGVLVDRNPGNFPETHDRANNPAVHRAINLKGLKWGGPSEQRLTDGFGYTNYLGCIDASNQGRGSYPIMVETLRLDKTGREFSSISSMLLITNYQGEKEWTKNQFYVGNATQVEICRALGEYAPRKSNLELFKEIYDFTIRIWLPHEFRYNPRWTFYLNASHPDTESRPLLAANQVDEAWEILMDYIDAALFHMYWSAASEQLKMRLKFGERVHVIRSMNAVIRRSTYSGTKGIVGAVRPDEEMPINEIRIVVRYPIPVTVSSKITDRLNKLAQPVQRGLWDPIGSYTREYDEAMRKGEYNRSADKNVDKAFCSETYEVYNDFREEIGYFAMSKDKNIVWSPKAFEILRELDHYANALKRFYNDIVRLRDETKCDRGVNNIACTEENKAGDFEKMERTGSRVVDIQVCPHFDRCEYVDADPEHYKARHRFDKLWAAIDSHVGETQHISQYLPNKGQAIRDDGLVIAARDDEYLLDTYGTTGIDGVRRPETAAKAMHAYGLRAIDFTLRNLHTVTMSHPDIIEDSYTISKDEMLTVLPAQKDGEFVDGVKKEATGKLQALLRGQTQHLEVMIDVIDIKYYTNHDNIFSSHDPLQHVIFFTRADLTNQRNTTKEGVTRAAVFARYGREGENYHDYCFNDIVEDSGTVCS
ncbi:hypothetical protein SPFM7_00257 [Salmonella phage SPFM7]|nr:hypothetical protein SPFM7_00257 [Salmonella phage SPFM7]